MNALGIAALWGHDAAAQVAPPPPSRITPETGIPDTQKNDAAIILPETHSARAPEGSDNLAVILRDINVEGAGPEFAELIAAQTSSLEGRSVTVADLYQAAAVIEAAYAKAGYILTRATVPPQTLTNGAVFRIVIVEGYVETVDVAGVPERVRGVVRSRVAPLIGAKGARLKEIERRLVLANDIPGISLKSTLVPGEGAGAAKLVIEGDWQPTSFALSADNRPSDDYDSASLSAQLSLNSVLGIGELIYAQATTAPDFDLYGKRPLRRIYALGAVVPVGNDGLTINPEYIRSDTNPDSGPRVLRVKGAFERLALRAAYPLIRTRRQTLGVNGSFEAVSERQTARDFQIDLSKDRLRYVTFGIDWSRSAGTNGNLTSEGLFTQGFSGLGARTFTDALASGVPFSRQGAKPDFSKAYARIRFDQRLTTGLSLSSVLRGQSTLSGALSSTAQFSLDGNEAISGFDLGAINVDSGVTGRSELSGTMPLGRGGAQGVLTPYLFGSFGFGDLKQPTFFERRDIDAWSVGGGIRFVLTPAKSGLTIIAGAELANAHSNNRPESTRLTANIAFRF